MQRPHHFDVHRKMDQRNEVPKNYILRYINVSYGIQRFEEHQNPQNVDRQDCRKIER